LYSLPAWLAWAAQQQQRVCGGGWVGGGVDLAVRM
jgi:hypothetical protein